MHLCLHNKSEWMHLWIHLSLHLGTGGTGVYAILLESIFSRQCKLLLLGFGSHRIHRAQFITWLSLFSWNGCLCSVNSHLVVHWAFIQQKLSLCWEVCLKLQALNIVDVLSLLNDYILIYDKNYNHASLYIRLYSLAALSYTVIVLCFWEGFFLWPVSQRKHITGVLLKSLLVFPSSSACRECFSVAGGLTGAPQVPEVNDSRAEILVIEPLAIDLHQWYITAKCSWVVGVLNRGVAKTLITGWHNYF